MAVDATADQARQISLRDWALLILLGGIWGGSFFFARIAVAEIPPLNLVMFRVVIATLVLQLWLALRGPSFRLAFPMAGSFFILAILNNIIPFSLMFLGQTELGAGREARSIGNCGYIPDRPRPCHHRWPPFPASQACLPW